jgi:hypothetical protein
LATNEGPVILVNKFTVQPEDAEQLIKAWGADAEFFKPEGGEFQIALISGRFCRIAFSIT